MDGDFLLVVIMVISVVAIIGRTVTSVAQKVIDYKREKHALIAGPSQADTAQETVRAKQIEDRLAVLERLATDPETRRGAELADEIEQLRIEQLQEELS